MIYRFSKASAQAAIFSFLSLVNLASSFAAPSLAVERPVSLEELVTYLPEGLRVFLFYIMNGRLVFFAAVGLLGLLATIISIVKVLQISRELIRSQAAQTTATSPQNTVVARLWFGFLDVSRLTAERRRDLGWKLFAAAAGAILLVTTLVILSVN